MSPATTHLIFLAVVNIPVYYLLFRKVFFDDWDDFLTCVRFWLTPDIISMFRGEWGEDWWNTMRLGIFVFLCAAIVFGEYHFFYQRADDALAALARPAERR